MAITKPAVSNIWANAVSASPDIAIPTYIDTGFPAPGGLPVVPPRGFFNWLFQYLTQGIRYHNSIGAPEWSSSETEYVVGSVVRDPADGALYQLRGTASPSSAPHEDWQNWAKLFDLFGSRSANRAIEWTEHWKDGFPSRTALGSGDWGGMWNYGNFGVGGSWAVSAGGPNPGTPGTYPYGPLATVTTNGTAANAASLIESKVAAVRTNKGIQILDVDFSLSGASNPKDNTTYAIGFGDGTLVSGALASRFADDFTIYGAGLVRRPTYTHWAVWCKPPGGSYAEVITGVPVARAAPRNYRVEIIGLSNAIGGAASIRHFIDGASVATQSSGSTFEMDNAGGMGLFPFVRQSALAGEGDVTFLNVGPMNFYAKKSLSNLIT